MDSTNRVWARGEFDQTEQLLYDFSLQVGDSALMNPPNGLVYPYYARLDSITTGQGRQRYNVTYIASGGYPTMEDTWIWGVGSETHTFDPTWTMRVADWGNQLLCYYKNGVILHQGPGYVQHGSCYVVTVSNEPPLNGEGVLVYPNPTQGLLRIDSREEISNWNIFTANGRMVAGGGVFQLRDQLDLSQLSPGIYFLRLRARDRQITNRIMIH